PGLPNPMHAGQIFAPPPIGTGFRQGPNMMPIGPPPGIPASAAGRGFGIPHPPPGLGQPAAVEPLPGMFQNFGPPKDGCPSAHSRQPSSGFDSVPPSAMPAQPISRPGPIGRPASVVLGQRPAEHGGLATADVDDASSHLGS